MPGTRGQSATTRFDRLAGIIRTVAVKDQDAAIETVQRIDELPARSSDISFRITMLCREL